MNRRDFFTLNKASNNVVAAPAPPPNDADRPKSGLNEYSGQWTKKEAKHLLNTISFGAKKSEIDLYSVLGKTLAVEKVLIDLPPALPPLTIHAYGGDTENLPWHLNRKANQENRVKSLKAWMVKNMLEQEVSIGEKMLLFWHNHFATSCNTVGDARFSYQYIDLLRKHALGNFKTLAKEISTNAAMLKYLSGDQNVKGSPNENYARELLELFTLGPEDRNGNPNYTETDVEEAAKVLTGWQTNHQGNGTFLSPYTRFVSAKHDNTKKQFSSHFNNQSIHEPLSINYEKELDQLIDMIFDREECALFIVRQLYTWFVYYDIDDFTEDNIIVPLAVELRNNGYEIKPILRRLFNSQHFYDQFARGTSVKSPAEYVVGTLRKMEAQFPLSFPKEYNILCYKLHQCMAEMQMDILEPPNVAGWSAFYQAPEYYQKWINTATYNRRSKFAETIIKKGIWSPNGTLKIDCENFVMSSTTLQGQDVNQVIQAAIDILLPLDISDKQKDYLKYILLQGLPDFEWTVEWMQYLPTSMLEQNPTTYAMRVKLESLFFEIMNMAEFHLN